jgi:hypothetical protein
MHVGMNREPKEAPGRHGCVPQARGDEPDAEIARLREDLRAPCKREAPPAIGAVGGPVVVRRLLEGPRLLVPLGAVASEAFQALRAPLGVDRAKGIVLRPALTPSIGSSFCTSSGLRPSVTSVSIRVRAPGDPTSRTSASGGCESVP